MFVKSCFHRWLSYLNYIIITVCNRRNIEITVCNSQMYRIVIILVGTEKDLRICLVLVAADRLDALQRKANIAAKVDRR